MMTRRSITRRQRQAALIQGGYYLTTGLWPLLSLRTFEKVTGPKEAPWLVKTFGLLVTSIGYGLVRGAMDPKGISAPLRQLAISSAAALTAADVYYAGIRRRIAPSYLLDALAELLIVKGWLSPRKRWCW